MNVWCKLPTIFSQRHFLRLVAFVVLIIALITTLFLGAGVMAAPGVNKTVSFQGRLLDDAGKPVPDGNYNIQFKIYESGTGKNAGNPDGSLVWTETYANTGGTTGAPVKDGYLSVNLGSRTPFGTSVDWNQDTLWLSMNIAGSGAGCTAFGTSPCIADGEMLPMKRITATPFSINSGQVGGKTVDQLTQLGQGVQTDDSANSSIAINKTGAGSLIQLQNMATDVFTIAGTGDILFGGNANHSIGIAKSPINTVGMNMSLAAGNGGDGSGSAGGTLTLSGGNGGGTDGDGGSVEIDAGESTGSGAAGTVAIGTKNAGAIIIGSSDIDTNQTISIGTGGSTGGSSNVIIGSGSGSDSGSTTIQAKDTITLGTNGQTQITIADNNTAYFGNGVSSDTPDNFTLQGTNSSTTSVNGGSLGLRGGDATVGDANGGNVTISGGSGSGTGSAGLVVIDTPTFKTISNDANCYTDGAPVALSCSISNSTVNNASSVIVGFLANGQAVQLPDPAQTTAGRVFYVTASSDTKPFTLSINGGGAGNTTTLSANTAVSLMWNGNDWVITGTSGSANLQGAPKEDTETPSVQIGSQGDSTTTLLTLDSSAEAPSVTNGTVMIGSMYYDTTIGAVQCYEASGWGSCDSSPDTFTSLSPEYSNSVTNGTGIGTLQSDICSDTLNINDGSGLQDAVCGSNETYNYYNWTTGETNAQAKSIYVNYQLPSTFKEFVEGSTSLMGRTDSANSDVSYQIYRSNDQDGLTACGAATQVSTGNKSTWQLGSASGANDPANCGFVAGETMVIKITLTSSSNANAYASTLNFAFSNK